MRIVKLKLTKDNKNNNINQIQCFTSRFHIFTLKSNED